jgi:hypothetical protein
MKIIELSQAFSEPVLLRRQRATNVSSFVRLSEEKGVATEQAEMLSSYECAVRLRQAFQGICKDPRRPDLQTGCSKTLKGNYKGKCLQD